MAITSIAQTLGAGSGIDLSSLVTGLVDAQFATKTATLTQRQEALTAQISGVSRLRGAVTGLDTALATLIGGGTLASKLTSSNEAALKVTALPGADTAGLSASIGVVQLASAQVSSTNVPVARDAAWRRGTLTLQMGRDTVGADGAVTGFTASRAPLSISIGSADTTLDGIAARINTEAAKAGVKVSASIITDGDGARLVLRGGSGADEAFELSATNSGGSGMSLAGLAVGRTSAATTSGTRARDAIVQVDGVRYARSTNSVEGVVPGVTLDLLAVTTAPATVATSKPGAALSSAVTDFVSAYNEILAVVKAEVNPVNGALRSDPAAAAVARGLRTLTTALLNPGAAAGAPRTLADLGVATARDGTLSVDTKRLGAALSSHPDAVAAMFTSGTGLSAALSTISAQATSKQYGLDAASLRYTAKLSDIAEAKDKLTDASEQTRTRLTRQFASMDSRVAAYRSTQTFLEGQIAAWNKSDR